jgi:hypothetical protein
MMKAIGYVGCVIVGTILSIITTIVASVQQRNMATEANYWNNYFKTHHK